MSEKSFNDMIVMLGVVTTGLLIWATYPRSGASLFFSVVGWMMLAVGVSIFITMVNKISADGVASGGLFMLIGCVTVLLPRVGDRLKKLF